MTCTRFHARLKIRVCRLTRRRSQRALSGKPELTSGKSGALNRHQRQPHRRLASAFPAN